MGILLYELAHGRVPFNNKRYARNTSVNGIINCKPSLNKDIVTVIKACLHSHVNKRKTAK